MLANRPADFLAHVGFYELRAPIAMVRANQSAIRNVVQQTRQYHLFIEAGLHREFRALQQMIATKFRKAKAKKIQQLRLVRHLRQQGIVTHHEHRIGTELRHEFGFDFGLAGSQRGHGARHDQAASAALK